MLRKKADELLNRGEDIIQNYDIVEEKLDSIKSRLDNIKSILNSAQDYTDIDSNLAELTENIDSIVESGKIIYDLSNECKAIGQHNEDMLKYGNDIIKEISVEFEQLDLDLEELTANNVLLQDEYDELTAKIEELESLVVQIDETIEARVKDNNKRLVKKSSTSYNWICEVHDEMSYYADEFTNLKKYNRLFVKLIQAKEEKREEWFGKLQSVFADDYEKINTLVDKYLEDMNVGRDMNERMSNALHRKIALIQELRDSIEEITPKIEELSYTNEKLSDDVFNLQQKMSELDTLLL